MISRERFIDIPAKRNGLFRLRLTSGQRDLIFWITAICAPGLVLTFGLSIWASRRAS